MWRLITQSLLVISVAIVTLITLALITLRLLGGQLLAVQSNSMLPAFQRNDVVISLPSKNPREGTVISYRNPTGNDMIVSHRVVAVNRELRIVDTLGDAQQGKPVSVPLSAIEGRVVAVIPGLGNVLAVVRNPAALLLLVYIPSAVFLYNEFHRLQLHFAKQHYRLVARR